MTDEPGLLEQTMALGKVLMTVSDRDPDGTPSAGAIQAFRSWLEAAGPTSREPRYFADISENYEIGANSNRDLFKVFELLHPYIEVTDEEDNGDEEGGATGSFIGLPVVR